MNHRIITASNARLRKLVKANQLAASQLGIPVSVYDLGGLGYGTSFHATVDDLETRPFPPATFKPKVMRHAAGIHKDAFLVWMDADCILQGPIDDALDGDGWLACVTEREPWEIEWAGMDPRVRTINSGVVFFRNDERLPDFLDAWAALTDARGNDQQALNDLAESGDWPMRRVPTKIYNNYYFAEGDMPKIRHYKGDFQRPWL